MKTFKWAIPEPVYGNTVSEDVRGIEKKENVKRFIMGSIASLALGVVPISGWIAFSVWILGQHDPKFGPYGTWLLSTQIGLVIAAAAFIGFAASFPLLVRKTRDFGILRYLGTITIPVASIYLMLYAGAVAWLLDVLEPNSFIACIPIGVISYLPGLALALFSTTIMKGSNKSE